MFSFYFQGIRWHWCERCVPSISSHIHIRFWWPSTTWHKYWFHNTNRKKKVCIAYEIRCLRCFLNQNICDGFRSRRNATQHSTGSSSGGDWREKCRQLLDIIWNHEDSQPFREPVDTIDIPGMRSASFRLINLIFPYILKMWRVTL